MLPPLHGTWPSPCYPVLDVVEKTLGHERVLIQVDQVRCLGETNEESSLCALPAQALRDALEEGGSSAALQTASAQALLPSASSGRHIQTGPFPGDCRELRGWHEDALLPQASLLSSSQD